MVKFRNNLTEKQESSQNIYKKQLSIKIENQLIMNGVDAL